MRVDGGEHPVRINLNVFRTKDRFIFAFFFQYNSPRRIPLTQSCRVQNVCVYIERKSRLIFSPQTKILLLPTKNPVSSSPLAHAIKCANNNQQYTLHVYFLCVGYTYTHYIIIIDV